ncbi:MAG: MBL fold metallo-hydrolase [Candidatus Uhrbacteria bacterium]|nr:MBL fold metallo-hydrolase [Candidatus Uhrbacteria bacterium]
MKSIGFYGGAGGVTGANYIFEWNGMRIMIDCGLFQGGRFAEGENHKALPYDPRSIDAVCITHAHADHIGRLPKLIKEGYAGPIYSTEPTAALARVMLQDAFKIMRHECEYHKDEPLYTEADMNAALNLFHPIPYNTEKKLNDSVSFFLRDSAHILGSAMIEMHADDRILVFTGDIGNTPSPLLKSPYPLDFCDYLLMESVYGDRFHEPAAERKLQLERLIEDVVTHQGTLIIPAFALERTQELLAELNELVEHNRIPRIPVYLDSPLAIHATEVYKRYTSHFNEEAQKEIAHEKDLFHFPGLIQTLTREQSQSINTVPPPKIIIAGNPHGYGSRIAHHFIRMLPDPNNTVLFVGYARVSSLGRNLVDGAREVSIFGKPIPVRAQIAHISGYSSHADQAQLKNFVSGIHKPIKNIFVAMGDESSAETLAGVIRDEIGIHASVPKMGDVVELE